MHVCLAGRHRGEIAKFIAAAKGRVKDPDSARSLEAEMQESVEYLDVNAALAMAAMLLVGIIILLLLKVHFEVWCQYF